MPMDIRNFFGKATPKPGLAKKPDADTTNVISSNNSNKNKPKAAISKVAAKKPAASRSRPAAAKDTASSKAASQVKATVDPEKKSSSTSSSRGKASKSSDKGSKQAISVNMESDDDDEDNKKDVQVVAPTKRKPQPSTKQDAPNKKKSRVIIDDDSDDDDDNVQEVESKPKATTTTKSPAKKTTTPSPAKQQTSLPPKATSRQPPTKESSVVSTPHASNQHDKLNPRRTSSGKVSHTEATPSSQQQPKEIREEVSVEDFFGSRAGRKRSTNGAHPAVTKTATPEETKNDTVLHDDEDDDEKRVGGLYHYDDDDDEDDDPLENYQEDEFERKYYDEKKAQAKRMQASRRTTSKRKKLDDEDDEEEDEKPPPRKSPRKQSSKAGSNASSKPAATRTSPRKQPNKASSSSTKPPPFVPLDPGSKVDSFDLDAVVVSECLAGATFVFSGIMPELNREDAQELVKTLGGRVTTTVSNKTTYLVLGDILEDGRAVTEGKKYQLAKEKNVRLVKGEKELYGLAKLYHDRAVEQLGKDAPQPKSSSAIVASTTAPKPAEPRKLSVKVPSAATAESKVPATTVEQHNLKPRPSSQAPIANVYAKRPPSEPAAPPTAAAAVFNPYAKKISNPYASQKPKAIASTPLPSSAGPTPPTSENLGSSNRLWADKFAPQVSQEVLGNKDMVDKLAKWLQRWEANFSGNTKVKTSDSGPKKAALLSGPPGIGKTTTAHLVGKEAGRDILEFNASDVRSKKALQTDLGDVTGSQSINFEAPGKNGKAQSATRKRVLIMDEVDGMGAGDRQGMAELIKMIKASRVPIICICNDRQSQKIRSLVPYCLDLRFRRPSKSVIANRAIKVASMEGLQVERNAAEAIAESCGNDVRQVLNCLQMWASQGNHERMTYKDLKDRENFINKDDILRVNIFDATKMIVEGRRGLNDADKRAQVDSFFKRNDAFFVDYSLMGLNVHQNYMKVLMAPFNDVKRTEDPEQMVDFLDRMHDAAHAMSDFAVVEKEIRGGDMNWSLLPFSGVLAVKTGYHAGGENGSFFPGFPDFPAWMGKNSTRGKKARILQELSYHMNYKVSGGRTALRLSYVPKLRERLYSMIANADESDTTKAIHLMDEYGLDRDDVFEKLDEFKIDSKVDFGKIEGKAKAAFTREYNSASHKSQALVAEQGAGSKRKRGAASNGEKDPADLDAIDEDGPAEVEESDGDAEEEDFEKIKKIFGKSRGGRKSGGQASARGGAKSSGGQAKARGGAKAKPTGQNKRSKK